MSTDINFKNAVGVAEQLGDCLAIIQKNARQLAEDADVTAFLNTAIDEDSINNVRALAARSWRLSRKVDDMLNDMRPRLSMVVAIDGQIDRQTIGSKTN